MTAIPINQSAASSDGQQLKGFANFLTAVAVLLVLVLAVLVTAIVGSPWLWAISYSALLLGFPLYTRIFVRKKWRNLTFILYGVVAAAVVVGGLVQTVLAAIMPPPGPGTLPLDLVCGALAGLLAALAVPFTLVALVRLSAQAVLGLHEWAGVTPNDAFGYLWSIILGTNQPWVVVENGEVVGSKKKGILDTMGGPGLLIVRPGNAVVLQRTGEISQIVGPGLHRVRRHEKIRRIVRLGPLWNTQDVEDVLTRDGVPLTIRLGVGYRIESKEDTDRRIGPPANPGVIEGDYLVYEDTIRKAVLNVTPIGWEITACAGCESQLRDIIGTYTLGQLFGLETVQRATDQEIEFHESQRVIKRIEERILNNLATGLAANLGINIRTVDIQSVMVPEQVEEQMLEAWSAEWRQRTQTAMRTTAAAAFAKMERIKLEARKAAFEQVFGAIRRGLELFDSSDPRFDRYVETITKLAVEMSRDSTSAYRYAEAVEKLMEHPNAQVVIAPPEAGMAFRQGLFTGEYKGDK
jgi:regulator of protease activity HflC (stomatin/prohibitin superfamily)